MRWRSLWDLHSVNCVETNTEWYNRLVPWAMWPWQHICNVEITLILQKARALTSHHPCRRCLNHVLRVVDIPTSPSCLLGVHKGTAVSCHLWWGWNSVCSTLGDVETSSLTWTSYTVQLPSASFSTLGDVETSSLTWTSYTVQLPFCKLSNWHFNRFTHFNACTRSAY